MCPSKPAPSPKPASTPNPNPNPKTKPKQLPELRCSLLKQNKIKQDYAEKGRHESKTNREKKALWKLHLTVKQTPCATVVGAMATANLNLPHHVLHLHEPPKNLVPFLPIKFALLLLRVVL